MKKNIQRFTQCNFKRTKVKTSFLINLIITLSFLNSSTANAQEEPDIPIFSVQPMNMCLQKDESCTLTCMAEHEFHDQSDILYRWYVSSEKDNLKEQSPTAWSSSPELAVEPFSEKGIRYYLCETTIDQTNTEYSDVVAAAHTGLPILLVNTPGSIEITSKKVWTQNTTLTLVDTDDESWNFTDVSTSIRGRGNSTWYLQKKPYALKLDKKRGIMGMPSHKRWVLIANHMDNSFLKNHLAFFLSDLFEMDYTVHGKFVDLIFNGEYRGLYWLGEAIKVDENRVDINDGKKTITDEEDKDYLIEMCVNYDEIVKFKSSIKNLPYQIKNDDYMIDDNDQLSSGGVKRLERLQKKINKLETLLYPDYKPNMNTKNCVAPNESYTSIIDLDSWSKFWIINELMDNGEINHPKSCYFTYESSKNIFKAGPVWDFDWGLLYNRSNCRLQNAIYYDALFKSPSFVETIRRIWNNYSSNLNIQEEIETMHSYLSISADLDKSRWGIHLDPSKVERADYDAYVSFLLETFDKKFNVVNDFLNNDICRIKYNLNGGTLSSSNPEVFISKSTAPFTVTNPTKDGYMFAGWIGTGLDGLTETINISDDHLGDKEFTAVWLKRKDITLCDLTIDNAVFSGEAETPIITLTDSNLPLISSIDYTVTLPGDCVNVGEYTVTITGIGKYIGTLTKTFSIIPKSNTDQENTTTPVVETAGGAAADKVWAYSRTLFIESVPDSQYKIIDLNGRTIAYSTTNSSHEEINIAKSGIFIVAINNHFYKVIIQ